MIKKIVYPMLTLCLFCSALLTTTKSSVLKADTTKPDVILAPKDKIPFDETTYAKEVDTWMKANKPHSASGLDLGIFIVNLKLHIRADGQKYGDEDLISRQYGAYILYDIAFVGNSVFSGLLSQPNQGLTSIPAPANGTYPNTVTENAEIPDKETNKTIQSTSYYIDNGSDKTVIMHGGFRNSWSNGNDNSQTRLFYDRGYNLLIVDNRATGTSGGDYITFGAYESDDVLYWINQEVTKKPNQKILLDGGSMGAATILSVLNKDIPSNVKGAVEDCGFASTLDQLSDSYDTLVSAASQNDTAKGLLDALGLTAEFKQENLDRVDRVYAKNWLNLDLHADLPLAGVKKSAIPKLFIHGTADSVVPYTNLARLADNSSGYKQIFSVPGADHGQSLAVDPKGYNDNLDQFLTVVFDDKVTVNYMDENGQKIMGATPKILTGSYGDRYDVSKKDDQIVIPAYTFKTVVGNPTGTFNEQAQTVNFVYTKNPEPAKPVTINYVDQANKTIHPSQTITGMISETYNTVTPTYQLAIDNYTLDENKLPDNAKGSLSDKEQTVTYVYKQKTTPSPSPSDNGRASTPTSATDAASSPLPDTGENQSASHFTVVLGLLLISLPLTFIKFKRYVK